ncbi:MAG: DegT/DnrJ/EryC1/StrS family aminotransferase [Treponema sp.]|jgi:dTDP-4-amino-4,6-dideoxygalactose transaminase|nr:DegT/DnrJ/EryC1/StrS family aminotransferase [Treponema sp.]
MKIEVYSPTIRRKEMDAVLTAMVEDRIGPGERARLLIQIAKEHLHFDYCLSLRSPAIALFLALKALNLEDGQGVLISALSPRYYTRVIEELRLKPVFCDVGAAFPCMSRETIENAIKANSAGVASDSTEGESFLPASPRCIVVHHTLGFLPDIAAISELGLPVIEDVSQSCGAFIDGEKDKVQGSEPVHGVFTILGLEEKDILTSGGGALLYAMNRRDASVLRNFTDLPPEFCLPDINAALAAVQFRESPKNIEKRREIAAVFTQSSLRTRHKRFIPREEGEYNNYAFPLILETGLKDVVAYARKKEITVESAFEDTLVGSGAVDSVLCPESYSLSLRTVLFPLYPRLRSQEVDRISKLIVTLP